MKRDGETQSEHEELCYGRGPDTDSLSHVTACVVWYQQHRYGWQHGIEPKRADLVAGKHTPRARRVSLTYRTVAKSAGNA